MTVERQHGLARLVEAVRAQGGLVADALDEAGVVAIDERPGPAQVAAAGPRADGRRDDYELLVEAIYEGFLLHYHGRGRAVVPEDPDLALLAGDQLYAFGLARLAGLGDLEAIAELADVIALCAQAHAAADEELADAVWAAGAVAVGWGSSPEHEAAKQRARAGDAGAGEALREVARASAPGGFPKPG